MTKMMKLGKGALAPKGLVKPPIKVKHVMLLDTGDGAFIDESVKVKPHKTDDAKLAVKCTDLTRLFDALERMGLTLVGPPVKGAKHYIAFVWKKGFGDALLSQGAMAEGPMLDAHTGEAVAVKALPEAVAVKGGGK